MRDALRDDDPRLMQGATTKPPPLMVVEDFPVEAACALGFCGWRGNELGSVGDVRDFFGETCFRADELIGEPAACRWFLNYWDETPRKQAFTELLEEVDLELGRRLAAAA